MLYTQQVEGTGDANICGTFPVDLPSICVNMPNKLQGYTVIYSGLLVTLLPLNNWRLPLPGRQETQLLQAVVLPESKTDYLYRMVNSNIQIYVIHSFLFYILLSPIQQN